MEAHVGEKLSEFESRYLSVYHSALNLVFVLDDDGQFIDVNETTLKKLNYTKEQIDQLDFFRLVDPDRRENAKNLLVSLKKSACHEHPVELMLITGQNGRVWVEIDGSVFSRNGFPSAIHIIGRDITHRKRAENAQKLSNVKLMELDQQKSEFLSTVSHELRTPMATMKEGISLCLDGIAGNLTETQRELLTDTVKNIDRMGRLVTDLLDISKIEAGKLELRRRVLDMADIVRRIHNEYKPLADEKNIVLELSVPKNPLILYVDGDKVMQIFSNLLSNAFRYTNSGGSISIGLKEEEEMIRCSVSDTGTGIAKEHVPKLFSKFTQIGRIGGKGYKGTGLGLAIVKGLVERHGGKVGVKSVEGAGSTFWFTIKKVPLPKILIVEDDPKYREVVDRFLQSGGYEIHHSENGKEALEITRHVHPSLIILDLMLPGMNGYEIIGRLKQDKRTQHIPILINSGFEVDNERLDRLNNHTAIPVIKKPFAPEELQIKVCELLVDG